MTTIDTRAPQGAGRKILDELAARLGAARPVWHARSGALEVRAFDTGARAERGYLLIDEAIDAGLAIEEAPDAVVPALLVCNPLPRTVLILDGDVVVGGRQDRVANATVLVAAGATVRLPVSCVEARRWGGASARFRAARASSPSLLRRRQARSAARRAARGEEALPDQGEVWNEVAAYHVRLGPGSPTGALEDAYRAAGEAEVARVARILTPPADLVADTLAVTIGAEVASLDLLASPSLLHRRLRRTGRALALDSVFASRVAGAPDRSTCVGEDAAGHAIARFFSALRGLDAREVKLEQSRGLGLDLRLVGRGVVGSGLANDGRLVALAAFPGG